MIPTLAGLAVWKRVPEAALVRTDVWVEAAQEWREGEALNHFCWFLGFLEDSLGEI